MARLLLVVLVLLGSFGAWLYWQYGGGQDYAVLAGDPLVTERGLEEVLSYDEPIGNVAVSPAGQVFFTVHPESRAPGPRLMVKDGLGIRPFPDAEFQTQHLADPLGLVIDEQNRLWVIDTGGHGIGTPKILAYDTVTGAIVHEHAFAHEIAPLGSFMQDLQVHPDGKTVYIADVSFWRRSPAIVVYDVENRHARRVLEQHASVMPQDWIIRSPTRPMTFMGGLVAMKPGVDGLAISPDGAWLYYGAMSHDTLYRVPTDALADAGLTRSELADTVKEVGRKPLSDGLSADLEGNVYITDVEHSAVHRMDGDGRLTTVVKSPRIRWADALSFGPDGYLYLADSAIPEQVLRSRKHIQAQSPYFVFRFQPGTAGVAGR